MLTQKRLCSQCIVSVRILNFVQRTKYLNLRLVHSAQHAPTGVTGLSHDGVGHGIGWQYFFPPCIHGCGQSCFGHSGQHAPGGVTELLQGGKGHGIGWQYFCPPCVHGCGQSSRKA